MTCRKVAPLINDFADACLEDSMGKKIRDHLSCCARCAVKYEEISRLKTLLRNMLFPEPNGNYFRKATDLILSRVLAESQIQKRVN